MGMAVVGASKDKPQFDPSSIPVRSQFDPSSIPAAHQSPSVGAVKHRDASGVGDPEVTLAQEPLPRDTPSGRGRGTLLGGEGGGVGVGVGVRVWVQVRVGVRVSVGDRWGECCMWASEMSKCTAHGRVSPLYPWQGRGASFVRWRARFRQAGWPHLAPLKFEQLSNRNGRWEAAGSRAA